jgi:hypothetical protein
MQEGSSMGFLGVIGIPDPWIWSAYLLCLAATALCVVYGALQGWGGEGEPTQATKAWAAHEKEVEEED